MMDDVFSNWHFGTEHTGIGILIWVGILIAAFLFYKAVTRNNRKGPGNDDDS